MRQKSGSILVIVLAFLLLVSISVTGYFYWQSQQKGQIPFINTQENQQTASPRTTPIITPTQKDTTNTIVPYFGKSLQSGAYQAINLIDGGRKDFIPVGYKIVGQYMYEQFPAYLILEKDKKLYSYQLENKLINDVFGNVLSPMHSNEEANVYSSITEKDKFFIVIDTLGEQPQMGMGLPNITSSRYYFFNASTNQLLDTQNKGFHNFQTCFQYDSKNSRFFTWPCGEGIGSALPISVTDLNGGNKKDVFSVLETGKYSWVNYHNGQFVIIPDRQKAKELISFDANTLKRESFTFTDNVMSQIHDFFPYSTVVSKNDNTIVVGESSNILLLKFDSSNKVTGAKYIPDKDVYANFVYVYNGKLYYQSKDAIRVVNLGSGQIEKSWSSPQFGEVTLLSL